MFTKRLLSGIVLVILAIVFVYQGGFPLFAVTMALALIGQFELYRALKLEKTPFCWIGYLTSAAYYALLWFDCEYLIVLLVIAALMLLMTVYVVTFPRYKTEEVTEAFFGVFYTAVMLSYPYQVRMLPDGKYLVWMIFLASWGSDTFAYCVGRLFGRHKMAPVLSPKKTVEGAIGGVAGAALLAGIYVSFFGSRMVDIAYPQFTCTAACAIAGVISQIGDLAASAIKRNHDIKDYGNLIPGHGGVLDRFDSMLFTAPAIYFAILFLR